MTRPVAGSGGKTGVQIIILSSVLSTRHKAFSEKMCGLYADRGERCNSFSREDKRLLMYAEGKVYSSLASLCCFYVKYSAEKIS